MNGPERSTEEIRAILSDLAELQTIDAELIALRRQLAVLSPKLGAIEARLKLERDTVEKAERNGSGAPVDRRKIEKEIHEIDEEIVRHKQRQIGLKTNKEYAAVNQEIALLAGKKDKLETRILESIEDEENKGRRKSGAHERYDKLCAAADAEKKRIGDQVRVKRAKTERLAAEREIWRRKAPADALRMYDRLSERHPGTVVTQAVKSTCGGCHMNLVTQKMVEIRQMARFVRCDGCLRFFSGEAKSE